MKVKDLISHSWLEMGQYITVKEFVRLGVKIDYSSENIGRYDFGKNQDHVLNLTVATFHPTPYGYHIDAYTHNANT